MFAWLKSFFVKRNSIKFVLRQSAGDTDYTIAPGDTLDIFNQDDAEPVIAMRCKRDSFGVFVIVMTSRETANRLGLSLAEVLAMPDSETRNMPLPKCFDCQKKDLIHYYTATEDGIILCPDCFELREKVGRAHEGKING